MKFGTDVQHPSAPNFTIGHFYSQEADNINKNKIHKRKIIIYLTLISIYYRNYASHLIKCITVILRSDRASPSDTAT